MLERTVLTIAATEKSEFNFLASRFWNYATTFYSGWFYSKESNIFLVWSKDNFCFSGCVL